MHNSNKGLHILGPLLVFSLSKYTEVSRKLMGLDVRFVISFYVRPYDSNRY